MQHGREALPRWTRKPGQGGLESHAKRGGGKLELHRLRGLRAGAAKLLGGGQRGGQRRARHHAEADPLEEGSRGLGQEVDRADSALGRLSEEPPRQLAAQARAPRRPAHAEVAQQGGLSIAFETAAAGNLARLLRDEAPASALPARRAAAAPRKATRARRRDPPRGRLGSPIRSPATLRRLAAQRVPKRLERAPNRPALAFRHPRHDALRLSVEQVVQPPESFLSGRRQAHQDGPAIGREPRLCEQEWRRRLSMSTFYGQFRQ